MTANESYPPFTMPVAEELQRVTGRWWVAAILGVVTAVLGLLLLVDLATAVGVLAVLVAIALLADGFTELLTAGRQTPSWPAYLIGVVWIVFGVVALAWPGITLLALATLVGIGLIIGGVMQIAAAVTGRRGLPMWGLYLALGIITVIIGLLALVWPGITILTLAIWLGITLLFRGIGTIWFSMMLRRAHKNAVTAG
ncbi:hypothetical protein FPZ12_012265 [Amycolatopsis acidicola]|uniref:HdeD family acid-resistance protein n=1 Tax=Amycolatopsis acidicola TaxID=2596893 RepID=A0A5N0VBM1_9PSEU|nr:DUF308 domain-containing protein [Amycolatopsis acidicola]KAA9162012.1 hypothetical protein FPZ12_012265 [Amycolatopsis acidicola]